MKFGSDVKKDDSMRNAGNKILNAHVAGNMVIMCCDCRISYSGRGVETYLGEQKRTIIIKPDNSLLVHSTEGVKPENWQSSGSDLKLRIEDGELVIRSKKSNSKGELVVKCSKIYKSIHYQPPENEEIKISGTEQDMHDAIMKNPELIEDNFTAIKNEKKIKTGSIDIYGKDSNDNHVIIEVKRRKARLKDVDQLYRYVETMRKNKENVRGILVAPEISESTMKSLKNKSFEYVKLNPEDV